MPQKLGASDPERFWGDIGRRIDWIKNFTHVNIIAGPLFRAVLPSGAIPTTPLTDHEVARIFKRLATRIGAGGLQRHAVFVTAVSGALYKLDVSSKRLSSDSQAVRNLIVAIRQGWAAMDRRRIAPAPVTLRAIFEWVPMPFAVLYWRRLFGSTRGEYYFKRHARHAVKEMAALAGDVRTLLSNEPIPQLQELFAAIDRAVATTP
jgi:hypothetical protein